MILSACDVNLNAIHSDTGSPDNLCLFQSNLGDSWLSCMHQMQTVCYGSDNGMILHFHMCLVIT